LLAADGPPRASFLPGWQAVVPRNLHAEYVDGRHEELMNEENVQGVAAAIVFHLTSTTDETSLCCGADTAGSAGLTRTAKPPGTWALINGEARSRPLTQ